jgi:molybdate transport system substrate-binding protein
LSKYLINLKSFNRFDIIFDRYFPMNFYRRVRNYFPLEEDMKRHFLVLLSLACFLVGCSSDRKTESTRRTEGTQTQSRQVELIVYAAASLTDALTEISQRFESETGGKVFCNFASSSVLQQQIEKGAPADVFISASPQQVDALQQKGLVYEETRRDVLNNRLVLVAPVDSSLTLTDPQTLAQASIKRIAIGEPSSVPAGIYGKEALTRLGLWDTVQPKLIPGANVRATLAYVESGEVDVGIVYQTDATISRNVKVIYHFPDSSHAPIVYPAVVLRETKQEGLAREFLVYLKTSKIGEIWGKYGFSLVQ